MNYDLGEIIAFGAYFVVMIAIGIIFYKKTNTLSDYILGDRSIGPFVSALSAQASDMSGWLLMGLPGALYLSGMTEAWVGIGLAIGTYLNWLMVAKRLRNYSYVAGNSLTISEFFENRFHDQSGVLRYASSIVILVFFLIYTASGFVGGGTLFKTMFPELDYKLAVIITAVIIIAYTFLGGFKAVCWTDVIQGMMMLIAIVVVPICAYNALDTTQAFAEFEAMNLGSGFWNLFQNADGTGIAAMAIISGLGWGLGYLGMPHILVRFMATKDAKQIKTSRRIATVWVVIALIAAIGVGMVGRLALGTTLADAGTHETVFIVLTRQVFAFAPVIVGVLLSAILAAIMSTADSQLLVVSSSITNDFYAKLTKKQISQKKLVWFSRIVVIVVAVIAAILALDENNSIMGLVSYAWGGFGAAFGPVVLLSLFWRRVNKQGALAGMIVGFAVVILWRNFLATSTGLYELVPGFILALITVVVVSLLTKAPDQEVTDEFDQVMMMN